MKLSAIAVGSVILYCVTCYMVDAQTEPPKRDPAAVALVQRTLQSMVGNRGLTAMTDCSAKGTIDLGGQVPAGPFVWKVAGSEFRYENPTNGGLSILTSNHGVPHHSDGVSNRAVAGHVTLGIFPLHLPGLVLSREITDPRYSITLVNEAGSDPNVVHLHTSRDSNAATASVTPQDWFLDARTGVPIRVEYRLPDQLDASATVSARADFADYKLEDGVLVPHTIVSYVNGQKQATAHISTFEFNKGIPASEFDATEGGK